MAARMRRVEREEGDGGGAGGGWGQQRLGARWGGGTGVQTRCSSATCKLGAIKPGGRYEHEGNLGRRQGGIVIAQGT
jgi:hypothetical protein